jgi:RecA-family ATPase
MLGGDELDRAIGEIARRLAAQGYIGEENRKLSRRDELRFGTNGSLAVIIAGSKRGTWYDHELKDGGNSWKLVQEKARVSDVREWLVREGFIREPDTKRRREAREHWGNDKEDLGPIRATYDYVDEQGKLLFQVVRYDGHKFLQRRPDASAKGGWIWKRGGRVVLYRLPELIAHKQSRNGHPPRIYLCEGEKDVDRVCRDWGVVATTNPGGAGNWDRDFDQHFAGCEVIILEDNDDAGRERSAKLGPQLARVEGTIVRVVGFADTPEHSDISDWLDDGLSQSDLDTVIEDTEPYAKTNEKGNGHTNGHTPTLWKHNQLDEWAGREIPAREWIMEDWVPRGQTTGLYGVSGVLKTTFLVQLMMAASAGLYFCGRKIEQVTVYGLFCEDTTEEIVRRAHRIARFYGRTLDQFPNFHFASLVGVMDSEFLSFDHKGYEFGPAYQLFEYELTEYKPGLAVLDTLPDFFGGEEINRRQTSTFIRMLDALSMTHKCGMLCAAHPSMRGRSSGRFDSGNTGIEGKMRARLSLHDPGKDTPDEETPEERAHRIALDPSDKRILTRQNSNYAKPGETIELIIKEGAFYPAALDPSQNQRGPMRDLTVNAKLLEILAAIKHEGRYVNDSRTVPDRYLPQVFSKHRLNRTTNFSKRDFEAAKERMMGERIQLVEGGLRNNRHMEFMEIRS